MEYGQEHRTHFVPAMRSYAVLLSYWLTSNSGGSLSLTDLWSACEYVTSVSSLSDCLWNFSEVKHLSRVTSCTSDNAGS